MDGDCRQPPRARQAHAGSGPDQQRAHETRTGRVGNRAEFRACHIGVGEHPVHQGQQATQVVPRGQLGHHAAIAGVQGDLAVHGVGQQPAFRVVDGGRRLVAAGLDTQDRAP